MIGTGFKIKDKMFNKIKKINHKGFTLIEILVGVAIFTILMGAAVNFFVSSLEAQQKASISERLLDNVSYAMEYMSRSLRMAVKAKDDSCIPAGTNYLVPPGGKSIKFIDYHNDCWEFYKDDILNDAKNYSLVAHKLQGDKKYYLTADFIDIVFKATVLGDGTSDTLQPKVTLFLEAKGKKSRKPELQPTIKIQTTISQRNLDE
jgi:prepilin-type N-terminal cleavage/methylation domain-containing protein